MDLSPYARINPCGYAGLAVTQVLDLGGPGCVDVVAPRLVAHFARVFGVTAVPSSEPWVAPVLPATSSGIAVT